MCVFMTQVYPECTPPKPVRKLHPIETVCRVRLHRSAYPRAIDARRKTKRILQRAVVRKKFHFGVESVQFR